MSTTAAKRTDVHFLGGKTSVRRKRHRLAPVAFLLFSVTVPQDGLGCSDPMIIVDGSYSCGSCDCGWAQLYCSGSGGYCDITVQVCGSEISGSWHCY
jgi:hypothetical protein